ncbi:hypothetical protein K2X33_01455, partial [bacterium]|nr:hypothetical protein [bacterium]
DETSGFIRTYAELSRCLTEDSALRQSKVVDRFVVESLFSRIFPIPLSLEILPKTDFLHLLRDPIKAALAMQALGYNSPIEMKQRYLQPILAQTRGSTGGRPIPSSSILFGPTSSGKTYLFEILMKYLGISPYSYERPDNEEAGYMIIKCANLTETTDAAHPENLSVDKVLEHISNFLSMPRGHRGFLFFDDLHKATTPVLKKLMSFIQSLFEAENGFITVSRMGTKERRQIPVRNLNLQLSLNPTRDRDLIEKYGGDDDLTSMVLASLAREDFPVEESFLARFNLILNLNEFPSQAKVPSLIREVRATTDIEFNATPRLILVAPKLLSRIVEGSQSANAREFLSTATHSLLSLDPDLPASPLYIAGATLEKPEIEYDVDTTQDRIEAFVRANRVTKAVTPDNLEARLDYMSLLMDGFRVHVYQAMLQGAQRNPRLVADASIKNHVLAPLFLSTATQLTDRASLPLNELRVQNDELRDLSDDRREHVFELVQQHITARPDFFPIPFGVTMGTEMPSLGDLIRSERKPPSHTTRSEILSQHSGQILQIIKPLMAAYFRVDSLNNPPELADWFSGLGGRSPKEMQIKVGDALAEQFLKLSKDLNRSDLAFNVGGRAVRQLTSFDAGMFLLLTIDRALLELPWARFADYSYTVLKHATQDLSLGQSTAFQDYLFQSQFTPFSTITLDAVMHTLDSLKETHKVDDKLRKKMAKDFADSCEQFIVEAAGA